ncbi:MAG: hypothetical protein MIO93_10970 [ANME-2 cluster archaeon]|nr:hypothetical protein [ANME-2 cluster archaeon]
MSNIIIKKGKLKLEVDRNELIEVSETYDGVVFNFKGGLQLCYTDNFMPQASKQIMQNTSNSYPGKKLVFDLDNLARPVMVDAT